MVTKKTISKKKANKKISKKTSPKKKLAKKNTQEGKKNVTGAEDVLAIFGQPKITVTPPRQLNEVFQQLQSSRQRLKDTSAKERIRKLKHLRDAISLHTQEICEAIFLDFHKSPAETQLTEIIPVQAEITDAINNLKYWMAPQQADTPLILATTSAYVCYEPVGTVLILSPWNYPFNLAIAPLVPAIAAGNSVAIKPSEFTPHTSRLLKELIEDIFSEDEVTVLEGDHTTAQKLTVMPFDHIFFTGSTPVGKIVMKAAAQNLSTVTLELGGKSPVIVDETANIKMTAERVMWGKCVNAGQTCVAPDYIFLPEGKQDEFVSECKKIIQKLYGESKDEIQNSPDYCRLINERNFSRVKGLVDDAVKKGAKIKMGGGMAKADHFIEPTILMNVPSNARIMEEEIFGPVLPIITYQNLNEVFDYIVTRDKPLALYIFSKKNKNINLILSRTTAGGTTINDVMLHLANGSLPFGGVNQSGHGSYHGEFGFKAMSHERAVLRQGTFSTIRPLYPPYTNFVKRLINWTRRFFV